MVCAPSGPADVALLGLERPQFSDPRVQLKLVDLEFTSLE